MTVNVRPSSIKLLPQVTLRQWKTRRLCKWRVCRTISVKTWL